MDMNSFCLPEAEGWSRTILLLLVAFIIGLTLYLDRRFSTLTDAETLSGITVLACVLASLIFVVVLPDETKRRAGVSNIFESPLTFLTLAVGLAAYSSTILTKLRESITKTTGEEKEKEKTPASETDEQKTDRLQKLAAAKSDLETHRNNYAWLIWADRLLVVIGTLLIFTVVLAAVGVPCTLYQSLVMALFLAVIFYFAILHFRQWNRSIYKKPN